MYNAGPSCILFYSAPDYLESRGCDSADLSLKGDDPVTMENLYQQIIIGSDELDGDGALEAGESAQPFNYITGYLVKGVSVNVFVIMSSNKHNTFFKGKSLSFHTKLFFSGPSRKHVESEI